MKIIDKKEFAKATLNKNVETIVIYIRLLNLNLMLIHPAQKV